MDTASRITNLILRGIIAIVVSIAFLIMVYAVFIKGVKAEFAIASAICTLLLAVFTGLNLAARAQNQSNDEPPDPTPPVLPPNNEATPGEGQRGQGAGTPNAS